MPLVSILMPCYDAAETLEVALESLSRQSLEDFEVVCVDDGSQDATPELLAAWAKRDRRIRLLRQPHAGIISALNTGLAVCRAGYVARMDADDRAYPERIALQAGFLDAHPEVDVLGCRVKGFPEEDVREGFRIYIEWLNGLMEDADIRREIFVESPLPHPSVMYRRQAVLDLGGYQEHGWAEDYDLWLRLYLAGRHFARLPQVLLDWRERPGRLTRTDPRYSLENFLRAKAYYLVRGPLLGRDALILWGAGMIGRRLGKQLLRLGAPLVAYVDIDPRKIGGTRHGQPILAPEDLPDCWKSYRNPLLLAAVGARGARRLIRRRLEEMGFQEGWDWWGAA